MRVIDGITVWLSYSRFRDVGQSTFTHERTTITLNPVNVSFRYNLDVGFFRPYAAVGFTYLTFREHSAIGSVRDSGQNLSADIGFEIRFSPRVSWDIGARYEHIKVKAGSSDVPINLGGLQFGTAFYVSF